MLESYKEINKNCKFFSSIDNAISYGFDGYIVATPAHTHFDIAFKLIDSSQNVLIEKPVCLRYKDARKLHSLAKKKDVFVMGGHLLLFHPAFVKIKEIIDNKDFGNMIYCYSNRLNFGTVRKHENALWSLAPHDISLILWFCGTLPKKVNYQGFNLLGRSVQDSSLSSFKFLNDMDAHIFVSWLHPFKEHKFVAIFEKGMLSYEDSSKEKNLVFYRKNIHKETNALLDSGSIKLKYDDTLPLDNQLKYFVNSIKQKNRVLNNFELSVNVVKVLEKLKEN